MGIPTLNKFLQNKCQNCDDAIKCISLKQLKGKKVAVDTSIYLYRYESNGNLVEQFYCLLITLFKFKITPIFVFDGKIPTDTKEILLQRKTEKLESIKRYNEIQNLIYNGHATEKLQTELKQIKKKVVTMNSKKINEIKLLLTYFGVCFIDAPEEADILCVQLVKEDKVFACLSEDMDMFAYGCPRILRYISLINQTIVFYDLEKILLQLDINDFELLELCIVCGTDYNVSQINMNKKFGYWYDKMKSYKIENREFSFYEWLNSNGEPIDIDKINSIKKIFTECLNLEDLLPSDIKNGIIMDNELKIFLSRNGFIFE